MVVRTTQNFVLIKIQVEKTYYNTIRLHPTQYGQISNYVYIAFGPLKEINRDLQEFKFSYQTSEMTSQVSLQQVYLNIILDDFLNEVVEYNPSLNQQ